MTTTEVVTCKKDRKSLHLCVQCGKPAIGRLCLKHTRADRLRKRVATHSRRWKAGKRGRPPLSAPPTAAVPTLSPAISSGTVTATSGSQSL